MSYLLLLVLLVAFSSATASNGVAIATEFRSWMQEHDRAYESAQEYDRRLEIYRANKNLVDDFNSKNADVQMSLNRFADMSPEEFKSKVLMPLREAPRHSPTRYAPSRREKDLPQTYDWRDKTPSILTPVKDQGSAGTCWAFSTVENIESQWALLGHNVTSLSVEQIVDCDNNADPSNRNEDCGVFGGWPYLAYQYVKSVGGIETEEDYAYCSGNGKCYPCPGKDYNKTRCGPPPLYCNKTQSCDVKLDKSKFVSGLEVADWVAVRPDETEMQKQLVAVGPLSVLMNAELLQFYRSGVWHPPFCGNETDHAVLLVGYGVHDGLLEKKPYWLIRNSWGEKWGMDGYFMLARGKEACGITTGVTSSVLTKNRDVVV
ncbi:cysteine proteinase 1-like [Oscarella lobularis]|uniref:cysteine proteinase 1-like n=1 Tax=Oscarella lobularis TaxID=121494 RepID=UPI003313AA04